MKGKPRQRHVARTVLLVGEGDAELSFMQHLKRIYVQRGSGVAVTLKNARGKGAAHVVDFAIRQSRNAAYDVKAVLLDTDTDWNDKTRATARNARVQVMACEPCLEAVLLNIHKAPIEGRSTAQLKQDFAARFGAAASDATVYPKYFGEALINEAKTRCVVVVELFRFMTQTEA